MIVVDTNVIAYLYLPSEFTRLSEKLFANDPEWAAPVFWRSELRNVLALYLRRQLLDFDKAYGIQTEAEEHMANHEYEVKSLDVLRLAEASGCAACDCEFIALAQFLSVPLITMDKQVLRSFPKLAIASDSMSWYVPLGDGDGPPTHQELPDQN